MCALTDLAELYENGYLNWLDIQTHDDPFETQRDGFDILQGLERGSGVRNSSRVHNAVEAV